MSETRKVTITYSDDPQYTCRYWAHGGGLSACSDESFEEAKERLLERLRARPVAVPPPEEVELECKP